MRFEFSSWSSVAIVVCMSIAATPASALDEGPCDPLTPATCAPGSVLVLTPPQSDCFGDCTTPGATTAWTSQGPSANAPRLRLPKYASPAGFHDDVVQVDIEFIARVQGALHVENVSPTPCTTGVVFSFLAQIAPDTSSSVTLLPTSFVAGTPLLAPFDGIMDFAGTSGTSLVIGSPTPLEVRDCLRVTGLATRGYVDLDPSSPSDDFFTLTHTATWNATASGCAASLLVENIAASLEARVTYTVCRTAVGVTAFCFGDGTFADHTSACPCANNGAAGNGCANSVHPGGANLSIVGAPASDDVVLFSQFMPATSFTLFLQHSSPGDTVFDDGLLCAGVPMIRLRGRVAVNGETFYPNSLLATDSTTTLSQRGGVVPGSGERRYYACWYRNASTSFCPPSTANTSNGFRIDW